MRLIRSDRLGRGALASLLCLTGLTAPLAAQDLARVLSSEFSMSGREATLDLELDGGRSLQISLRDGGAWIDGQHVGDAARGSALDRSWRELLTSAMDTPTPELPQLLVNWSGSEGAGALIDQRLEAAFQPVSADALQAPAAPVAPVIPLNDSVSRLVERISELEQEVVRLESRTRTRGNDRARQAPRPFRHIAEGVEGIFAIFIVYTVLFSIAFAVIFFGGRKYIEGVADTARHATMRSFLVGLAAAFLVAPAFILGMVALIISIVGIPGLLLWIPGFPLAVVLAVLLGFLGVAHAAGEAFAERRFYVTDWFQRGNSYYFLLSGLGLMFALFLASQVVQMAGPWLRPIHAILIFLGVISTCVLTATGFGAVLISRGGKRPVRARGAAQEQDLFTEEAGV